ncbi:tetratricopeptide repeat protein [Hymenobacter daeguensis]
MKKLLLLLLISSAGVAAAQPAATPAQRDVVKEGIRLYDAGRYDEAVAKYQQVLAATPGEPFALSELALTYNAMGRNKEAVDICEKLLKADPDSDESVYVTYGNSLDALKKTKDAYHAYETGLKHHPNSASLYFNLGVAQATSGQTPASVGSFQQSVALSPDYASAHMSLGVMQLASHARVPAVLALARFLVLEPRGPRAAQRLPLLDKAMMQGVSKTGDKAVQINLSEDVFKGRNGKKSGPDNFGPAELLLSISGAQALSPENKQATEMERFSKQFGSLCKTLGELSGKQEGFAWNYYVPYFAELEKKGFVPAFTYLAHASQTDVPEVQQWLAAHPNEVAVFQEWSKNYVWPKALK